MRVFRLAGWRNEMGRGIVVLVWALVLVLEVAVHDEDAAGELEES
jgi:hypothetical protein